MKGKVNGLKEKNNFEAARQIITYFENCAKLDKNFIVKGVSIDNDSEESYSFMFDSTIRDGTCTITIRYSNIERRR